MEVKKVNFPKNTWFHSESRGAGQKKIPQISTQEAQNKSELESVFFFKGPGEGFFFNENPLEVKAQYWEDKKIQT